MTENRVTRNFKFEIRAENDEAHGDHLTGRAIVYDTPTDIAGIFREIIDRGALDATDLRDVRLLINHNVSMVPLARSRNNNANSSMQLSVDESGMVIRADLDTEKNSDARNLYSAVSRGDISGMSFMFTVDGDRWEDLDSDYPTRHITSIGKVFEVSAVTFPAYESTSLHARDAEALESAKAALESAKRDALESAKQEEEECAPEEPEQDTTDEAPTGGDDCRAEEPAGSDNSQAEAPVGNSMTREQIESAGIEEIESRMDEIRAIADRCGERAYTELHDEIVALDERRAQLRQLAEQRAAAARTVADGAGTTQKTFEEARTMSYEINSPEYRSAWLRSLQGKELTVEERTALSGGNYAIPQETANKIWGAMELYPLLNAIDVMHVPGTVVLPVEGTVNAAGVVAMGTAATDAEDTMTSVSLGIYKIIKTIEITADVEAMAVPAFENWLVDRLANKMFRAITGYVAAGTGSSQPTGLTTITATNQTYTKAAITYDDLLAIIAKLPTEWTPGASFVMSRTTFWQNVLAVKDTANHPVVVADPQSPAKFNIFGFPVILEDSVGTDIIFGNLKEGYVWNFGKDIAIDRDESVGFRSGSTVFRGLCLGDGKPTGVGLVRYTKAT